MSPITSKSLTLPVCYSPDDFRIQTEDEYDVVSVKGGLAVDRAGWPQLPIAVRRIAVKGAVISARVKLTDVQWGLLPGRYSLPPVQPPRPAPDRDEEVLGHDFMLGGEEYTVSNQEMSIDPKFVNRTGMPPLVPEVTSIEQFGDWSVVSVNICPIRYSPRNRVIRYASRGKLKLKCQLKTFRSPSKRASSAAKAFDLQRLIGLVDNPKDIKVTFPEYKKFIDIPPICPDRPNIRPKKRWEPVFPLCEGENIFMPPDILLTWLKADWPYVIITDDYEWDESGQKGAYVGDLVDAFERLARWKTMRGVRARVVSVSYIVKRFWRQGFTRDVQEAIREFLKYAYANWNMRWCLLGGDINIVPVRHVLGNISWYHIKKEENNFPDEKRMYVDAPNNEARYHAGWEFSADDLFLARQTGEVIRFNANADADHSGWYWTEHDYTTKSTTPTRYILIWASEDLLNRGFTIPQYRNMIPTDLYYSSLVSPHYSQTGKHDWDLDGNKIYGWISGNNPDGVDVSPDISVGRMPAKDEQMASDFIDRVLTYEMYRDVTADKPLEFDYIRRLTCIADNWASNWNNGNPDRMWWHGLDGAPTDKESVIDSLERSGVYTDMIERRYRGLFFLPQIRTNLKGRSSTLVGDLRDLINKGSHFLSVSGHGTWKGTAGISSIARNGHVAVSEMNNHPHYPICFVDSCLTCEFDRDLWTTYNRIGGAQAGKAHEVCLGKKIMQRNQGGALGYVGCSRLGVVGWSKEVPFWEALSLPGQAHLGRMLDYSRNIGASHSRYKRWQLYEVNLMGDPELPIYTETPKAFSVSHQAVVYGKEQLTVSVFYQEKPKTDVTVTVSQISDSNPLDKTIFTMVHAEEGHYTFDTSNANNGPVHVVVSARNFVPYVGKIEKVSYPVSPSKYHTSGYVYDITKRYRDSAYAASGDGFLYALSKDCQVLWFADIGEKILDVASALDGSVCVCTKSAQGPNVILFSKSGIEKQSWSVPKEAYAIAWCVADHAVYVALKEKGIYSFDTQNGSERWRRNDLETCDGVFTNNQGRVYVASRSDGYNVVRLKSDGTTDWTCKVDHQLRSFISGPGNSVFYASNKRTLHYISSLGVENWRLDNLGASGISMVRSGNILFLGQGNGVVRSLNLDGSENWQIDLGDRAECMILGSSNHLYVGAWHGVYALNRLTGQVLWFRETTGAIISLYRFGGHLFAGSRDGWVYRINIPFRQLIIPGPKLDKGRLVWREKDIMFGHVSELSPKKIYKHLAPIR